MQHSSPKMAIVASLTIDLACLDFERNPDDTPCHNLIGQKRNRNGTTVNQSTLILPSKMNQPMLIRPSECNIKLKKNNNQRKNDKCLIEPSIYNVPLQKNDVSQHSQLSVSQHSQLSVSQCSQPSTFYAAQQQCVSYYPGYIVYVPVIPVTIIPVVPLIFIPNEDKEYESIETFSSRHSQTSEHTGHFEVDSSDGLDIDEEMHKSLIDFPCFLDEEDENEWMSELTKYE